MREAETRSQARATAVLEAAVAELAGQGYQVVASGIIAGNRPQTATLAAILESHAMIHAAEGQLFRGAIARALQALGDPGRRGARPGARAARRRAHGHPGHAAAAAPGDDRTGRRQAVGEGSEKMRCWPRCSLPGPRKQTAQPKSRRLRTAATPPWPMEESSNPYIVVGGLDR